MTIKKNIYALFFAFVFVISSGVLAAYILSQSNRSDSRPAGQNASAPEENGAASTDGQSPNSTNNPALAEKTNYSAQEYPLRRAVAGKLKNVETGGGSIIISDDKDWRVLIAQSTEIFRDGERTALVDIQIGDMVAVLGREKTKNSDTLVADSIYAASEQPESPATVSTVSIAE